MDTTFLYIVTGLALVYALSIRIVQNFLMDKKLVKEVQEDSKRINEFYKEAMKSNDKARIDEAAKMNETLMPKMQKMLFGQMKMMFATILVFLAFSWIIGHIDPTVNDDIMMNMTAGASNQHSSFILNNASTGFWYVTVKAYNGDNEIAFNQTVFYVNQKTDQIIWEQTRGQGMTVSTSKEVYSNGDSVEIFASDVPEATRYVAIADHGNRFYMDLPFTIPILNLKRIYDAQSWFIFSAVILGLILTPIVSFIMNKFQKQNEGVQQ
ncbi:TMCO1/EMC3 family protein [Candidatus Micrarchaeota archaeon]|nr:TMCO1/EMC3 family protein [Candidatus Micrarchaeota archaeon]